MASGFKFGTVTTSQPNTLFGASFGVAQSIAPTSVPAFSFGTTSTTSSAPSLGFGATPSFGFGAPSTQATPSFNFASTVPASTTSAFSFGTQPAATTNFSLFGGLGATSTPLQLGGSLGLPTATATPFNLQTGSAFGSTTTQSSAFGGSLPFGSNLGATSNLQTVAQANVNNVANIWNSLSMPILFGDERDTILAKWNQLQAFWGTGKAYFAQNLPPVDFNSQNPFCRFKAVGYSSLPTTKPEDGLVALNINKKEAEVRNQQQQLVEGLNRILGGKPSLSIYIDGIKSFPDEKTEVIIYVVERPQGAFSKRVSTTELCNYLEQINIKPQLATMSIVSVVPKIAPGKEQLKLYLDNPPAGIDPLLWQQAKLDNPDSEHLIPVPMIGFMELNQRLKCQAQETKQHEERLDLIAEEISELQRRNTTTVAKIADFKRKQLNLAHRVLKIMVNQEIRRKMGFSIQAEEENLRIQLENIQSELNTPTQFKGRLNELLSQIRLQNHQQASAGVNENYQIDNIIKDELKQHLKCQQEGIAHLVNILKEDMEDLKIIETGLKSVLDGRRQ